MGAMKEYLLFLEEKGLAEWDEHFEKWIFWTDDIYAPKLLEEFKNGK